MAHSVPYQLYPVHEVIYDTSVIIYYYELTSLNWDISVLVIPVMLLGPKPDSDPNVLSAPFITSSGSRHSIRPKMKSTVSFNIYIIYIDKVSCLVHNETAPEISIMYFSHKEWE